MSVGILRKATPKYGDYIYVVPNRNVNGNYVVPILWTVTDKTALPYERKKGMYHVARPSLKRHYGGGFVAMIHNNRENVAASVDLLADTLFSSVSTLNFSLPKPFRQEIKNMVKNRIIVDVMATPIAGFWLHVSLN